MKPKFVVDVLLRARPVPKNRPNVSRSDYIYLKGESRDKEYEELKPSMTPFAWQNKHIDQYLSPVDYKNLETRILERSRYKCEFCTAAAEIMFCRYDFDKETKIRKLVRFLSICTDCFRVCRYGLAKADGEGKEARDHLERVRNLNKRALSEIIGEAEDYFEEINTETWYTDLSILHENGYDLVFKI